MSRNDFSTYCYKLDEKRRKKNRLFLAGVISKKKKCIADTQKTGLSALMTFIYRK